VSRGQPNVANGHKPAEKPWVQHVGSCSTRPPHFWTLIRVHAVGPMVLELGQSEHRNRWPHTRCREMFQSRMSPSVLEPSPAAYGEDDPNAPLRYFGRTARRAAASSETMVSEARLDDGVAAIAAARSDDAGSV